MSIIPRITFGIIVLNGEPFIRYNLRSLYRFAHEIIVIEGACKAAVNIATPDGHSIDTTLETIRKFQATEDPDHKVTLVTAEYEGHPDGFWPGEKDEMSQAYAKRATGNYLWQVDSDEFYLEKDMANVIKHLKNGVDVVTFPVFNFFGDLKYVVGGLFSWFDHTMNHFRVFAWAPGYTYLTHRPPTILDEHNVDARKKKWLTARDLMNQGIYLYHYSLLFPKQVHEKCAYYSNVPWTNRVRKANIWANEVYLELKRPYRVSRDYKTVTWLERFDGEHPLQVCNMMKDVETGKFPGIVLRETKDIERLLKSVTYSMGKLLLKAYKPASLGFLAMRMGLSRLKRLFVSKPKQM